MAKQSMQLDPNAASYTDDEIVGKVNAATDNVTRAGSIEGTAVSTVDSDDISEGTSNLYDTGEPPATSDDLTEGSTNLYFTSAEETKLGNIEENATVDQTGTEIQTAVLGLSDDDRKLVKTDPQTGEFNVLAIQRDSSGKLDVDYDDTAES